MDSKTAGPAHLIVQQLMVAFAQQKTLEPVFDRGLVSNDEALIALIFATVPRETDRAQTLRLIALSPPRSICPVLDPSRPT